MKDANQKTADELAAYIEKRGAVVSRAQIDHAVRLEVQYKGSAAILDIFKTGKLRPGGKKGFARVMVDELVAGYTADPGFIAQATSTPPETKRNVAPSYVALHGVLDATKHVELKKLAEGAALVGTSTTMVRDGLSLRIIDERLVLDGLREDVEEFRSSIKNLGIRYESRVESQFKERIPVLSASFSPEAADAALAVTTKLFSREVMDFLPVHDRRAVSSAQLVLDCIPDLPDVAPVVMPVCRAFEGFVVKLLVKIGLVTDVAVQEHSFNLTGAFDSGDKKKFCAKVSTHVTMLDGLKTRLKEHRHVRLHSQSSQYMGFDRREAVLFLARVSDDMKVYYKYFRPYFS